MTQLEIKFFWPLTEQIPLDLDYTNCTKPNIVGTTSLNKFILSNNSITSATIVTTNNFVLDVDKTIVRTKKEIPFYRKFLYKLLGLTWERK